MHQPGMTGCIYEGTSQAAVVQDVTIQVISVGCGSNAGIGGTPGNGSGPGSGGTNPGNGNNNGNNNGGNNNPGDDNPGHNNPGFSDKDGDPIITKPVKTLEPEEEEPEEDKNCEELQKLKTDTKIKQSFTDLQNKVSNTNLKREFGYSYAEGSDPVEADLANGSAVELAIPAGGSIYGGSHTHPVEANG